MCVVCACHLQQYARVYRIYGADIAGIVPTRPPQTNQPKDPVKAAVLCHTPYNMPEVQWQVRGNGDNVATVSSMCNAWYSALMRLRAQGVALPSGGRLFKQIYNDLLHAHGMYACEAFVCMSCLCAPCLPY